MTWATYTELAMRTNSDTVGSHGLGSLDFMHGAAGLVTEIKEWLEAEDDLHKEEELGDCCWFVALCMQSFAGFNCFGVPASKSPLSDAIELLDIAKRYYAYGKMKDGDHQQGRDLLTGIVAALGLNESHMRSNIAKLKARYPEGFTQADALHRDTDAEYMAIRGSD